MKKLLLSFVALLLCAMSVDAKTVYLNPGVWDVANPVFAIWSWADGGNGTLYKLTKGDSYYEVEVPDANDNAIFFRMPSNTTITNGSKTFPSGEWNRTGDLDMGTNNLFTIEGWNNSEGRSYGSWSTYNPLETETLVYNVTVPAGTPACYIVGDFNDWGAFVAMTKVDDTHYTITIENTTKASGYKYTASESWDNVEVVDDGEDTDVANRSYSENDVVAKWKGLDNTETLTYNVTVPAGTPACYIAGEMNSWSFTAMTKVDDTHYTITYEKVTKLRKYKYASGADWAYVEKDADGNEIGDRTWTANDVVAKWASVYYFPEGITSEANYFLVPDATWKAEESTYYAKFINKNDGTYTWVQGGNTEDGKAIVFYLAPENLPQSAVTRSGEGATYTHVVFFKSTTEYASLSDADITAATCKTDELVMDATNCVYTIGGSISTGIENVEVADGIRYAYGVVEAEGAIEVYSINGAVVARGNDNVDLRDLNRGIYIVRNGDQVRKVVR